MAISKSERNVLIIAMLLFTSVCLPGRCDGGDDESEEDEYGTDTVECHPKEADACFTDVNENLLCHVLSKKGRNCTRRGSADLCAGLADALDCTSDIVDTGCSESDGRNAFDNWLAGLTGAYTHLCQQKDYSLLDRLLKTSTCWNVKSFIRCVENKANLTYVSDLLTTDLDQHECNLLQMAVSICNEKAEKGRVKCRGIADAVNEAVAAFFASSACAGEAPSLCSVLKPQERKSVVESSSSSSSSALAIFLTLLVTTVLIGLITFVLVKRNAITINTSCRIRRGGDGDESVEENREDYGRFL